VSELTLYFISFSGTVDCLVMLFVVKKTAQKIVGIKKNAKPTS
jgi:hypothetical protein